MKNTLYVDVALALGEWQQKRDNGTDADSWKVWNDLYEQWALELDLSPELKDHVRALVVAASV